MSSKIWKKKKQIAKIASHWVTIFCEIFEDDQDNSVEYWRVEKTDSIVALTLQQNQFVLPPQIYRPGVGKMTLDFPGGRIPEGASPLLAVKDVIQRELAIEASDILKITAINDMAWPINSSFSNQGLFAFEVKIDEAVTFDKNKGFSLYPATRTGVIKLLDKLICLQCRAVLLDWYIRSRCI